MVLPPRPSVVRTTCVPPGNDIVTVGTAVRTEGTALLTVKLHVALIPSEDTVGPLRLWLPGVGTTV